MHIFKNLFRRKKPVYEPTRTALEWFETLNSPWRRQAIKQASYIDLDIDLCIDLDRKFDSLPQALWECFIWRGALSKRNYWTVIYDDLFNSALDGKKSKYLR